MKHILTASFMALAAVCSANAADPTKAPVDGYPAFAMGGDLSWTQRINDLGKPVYYKSTSTAASNKTDILSMTYDHGFDAIRLRVWVDPSLPMVKEGFSGKMGSSTWTSSPTYGYCSPTDTEALALQFANQGQRIMVCFHFSDTWADPARQYVPASWADSKDIAELTQHVVDHVTSVLTAMHDANINVAWVQIGNETNNGMLRYKLPETSGGVAEFVDFGCSIGSSAATTTKNFVDVFKAAADAAHTVYPEAKTVMHLANGQNYSKVKWTLNLLKQKGLTPDVCDYVGLSLYPCSDDYTANWQPEADDCISVASQIYSDYGFRTMICELGMNNEWSNSTPSSESTSQKANIEQCNTDVQALTAYLLEKLPATGACDGLFYWEPEVDYLDEYTKGACFSITPGSSWPRTKVTANPYWTEVQAASTFPAGGLTDFTFSGIEEITATPAEGPSVVYDLQGRRVTNANPAAGLYLRRHPDGSVTKTLIP